MSLTIKHNTGENSIIILFFNTGHKIAACLMVDAVADTGGEKHKSTKKQGVKCLFYLVWSFLLSITVALPGASC